MTSSRDLAERVHGVVMRLHRQMRVADAESALSAARLSALSTLVYGGSMSVGELAAAEHVTAPTMSRLVTALERAGYVSREADSKDGRRVRVVPMEAGIRALNEARDRRVHQLAAMLADLPAAEQETLRAATEILSDVLDRTG